MNVLEKSLERLTVRERVVLLGGVGVLGFVIAVLLVVVLHGKVSKSENAIKRLGAQFQEVVSLEGEYLAQKDAHEDKLKKLQHSNVRLVSLVEDAAKKSEIDIGQLRPRESPVNSDGIVESEVDLRATGLSVDRLEKFLNLLEEVKGVVFIDRLKIKKPYKKDVVDIELSITTYKIQG